MAISDSLDALPIDPGALTSPGPEDADVRPWDVAAPVGSMSGGRLAIVPGASRIRIAGNATLRDLWRARFDGEPPRVQMHPDGLTLCYPRHTIRSWARDLTAAGEAATLELAGMMPWRIEIDGGVSRMTADLLDVRLGGFRVAGGASQVDLTLARPVGIVPVWIGGGASRVTIRLPRGIAARLRVGGGAVNLIFDGQRVCAIGGEICWQSPDGERATDRYDIEVAGDASDLMIEMR
jgi:hypothetical protein